jgi:hypothetical protein
VIPSTFAGKVGLWAHVTDRLTGRLHDIKASGFDYLMIKVADGSSAYHPEALKTLVQDRDAAKLDLPFAYWAYVYPDDPAGNAAAICAALPDDASDLALDAEIEWEQAKVSLGAAELIQRVHTLCKAIKAKRPNLRLHLSSFWSPSLHADFPFRAFLTYYSATWMPQAYVEPGGRTAQEVETGAVTQGRSMIAGTTIGMVVTVNAPAFLPLLKARGIKEANVYAWDPEGDAEVSIHLAEWTEAIAAFKAPQAAA